MWPSPEIKKINDEHRDNNKILASPPASHLGEIHWHILRASTQMHSQTTVKKPAGPTGKFVQYEQTEFGKEVGRDEINWWVFKKEANLEELGEQTEQALAATQVLKNAAAALKEHRPETYEELLGILQYESASSLLSILVELQGFWSDASTPRREIRKRLQACGIRRASTSGLLTKKSRHIDPKNSDEQDRFGFRALPLIARGVPSARVQPWRTEQQACRTSIRSFRLGFHRSPMLCSARVWQGQHGQV